MAAVASPPAPASAAAAAPRPPSLLYHNHHHHHHHHHHRSRPLPPSLAPDSPSSRASRCSLRSDARAPPFAAAADDYASFDHVPLAAPPSALTSQPTHYDVHRSPSPLDDDYPSESAHLAHHRSLTGAFFDNCRPLVNRAASTLHQHTSKPSFHSPTKSLASFLPSRSSDWFNGSSAPINLGFAPPSPTKEALDDDRPDSDDDGAMMNSLFTRAPTARSAVADVQQSPRSAAKPGAQAGKFAWLLPSQKPAASAPQHSPTLHDPSDELLHVNISQSLFPHGPADPLAPSSFHDLATNAERLLTRFQSSYRALSAALGEARAEQSAQGDELDEAETRVRHLKMQLETMASRASDQDEHMQRLVDELRRERQLRKDDEEARKRSVALVRGPGCAHLPGASPAGCAPDNPHRKRISHSDASIDSGFESEGDSEAASSIFSRANGARSPTDTLSSATDVDVPLDSQATPKGRPRPDSSRPQPPPLRTRDVHAGAGWGCANCEGGAQSAVWGRLAKEREDNRVLRTRVDALEDAVDGALNVVDGPWALS